MNAAREDVERLHKASNEPETTAPPETDEQAIARLAALTPLDFDRVREAEAKRMRVRVATLDESVKAARPPSDAGAGAGLFPTVEPWPQPVDPAALLDELEATFRRFAILPPHSDTALALWVAFTWTIDAAKVAPILALSSPEKRCGKTTVLSVVARLVCRALPAANISTAALFRAVEKWAPTLLIDEADTFLAANDELRGVLNSGHTRPTAFVIRTVGDEHEPTRFSTWGAKAIALIGALPETLHDRAIAVQLRRRMAGERVERLRHANGHDFEVLCRKLARMAADSAAVLERVRPTLPAEINDRAADNWEPLLAVAELAGSAWAKRARDAARAMSGVEQEAPSGGAELLADIREVFEARPGIEKLPSVELVEALCEDDEAPWSTYNRGKPLTPRQLARKLAEYSIKPKSIRVRFGSTPKGYEREQFADAFERYLSQKHPETAATAATPPQANTGADVSVADDPQHGLTAQNACRNAVADDPQCGGSLNGAATLKPAPVLGCGGVADKWPDPAGAGEAYDPGVEL